MSNTNPLKRITLRDLNKTYLLGTRLSMLTAYDASQAALVDASGVDMILVGDSLGNVVLGYETTIPVTLTEMIHHTRAVVRGSQKAFIICDMPFGTTATSETAIRSAIQIFKETECNAVKIEGGSLMAPTVRLLVESGIPVMGHIGLVPQSVHKMGGYFTHGKTEEDRKRLLEDAKAIEVAGAFSIVLECIEAETSKLISESLEIPTIGIGSGPYCSGEVLVLHDLLGLTDRKVPQFVRPEANLAPLMIEACKRFVSRTQQVNTPLIRNEKIL